MKMSDGQRQIMAVLVGSSAIDAAGLRSARSRRCWRTLVALLAVLSVGACGPDDESDPVCSIGPDDLEFGSALVSAAETLTVRIENSGGGKLEGEARVEPATGAFSIVGDPSYSLGEGDVRAIFVRFQPMEARTYSASVVLGGDCASISCIGRGMLPPDDSAVCEITPPTLNFGTVTTGEQDDTTFTIRNSGGGALSGTVSESCPSFVIVSGGGDYTLAAGASRTVTVRFEPTEAGPASCAIDTGSPVCSDVPCSGVGELPPICRIVSTELAFGSVEIGASSDRTFEVANVGGGTLIGTPVESCEAFTIISGAGEFQLQGGQSVRIGVRFSPPAVGEFTCGIDLGMACDAISLTGEGIGFWSELGSAACSPGGSTEIFSLLELADGNLAVGGNMSCINNVSVGQLASFDGTTWSSLGGGVGSNFARVNGLTLDANSDLIAVGHFDRAGTIAAENIARWDGESWSALGSGLAATGFGVARYGTELVAAGDFDFAGGNRVNHVALWNNSAWATLGTGITGNFVNALAVNGTDLLVGGTNLTAAGGRTIKNVALWNGSAWSPLGEVPGNVFSLTLHEGSWIAASQGAVYRWNGVAWDRMGGAFNRDVFAVTSHLGRLIAGGTFTTNSGTQTRHIAEFVNGAWRQLGAQGLPQEVQALTTWRGSLVAGTGNSIARWSEEVGSPNP